MRFVLLLVLLASVAVVPTTAHALEWSDVYMYYRFDDTSGTVFADSGLNGNDATLYRFLRYSELPAIDASNVTVSVGAPFGAGTAIGTNPVGGVSHEVMIDVPSSVALPGAGDAFAVSFWLNVANWSSAWGSVATYKLNGLDWRIAMHNDTTVKGLLVWTGDADGSGDPVYAANCVTAGLVNNAFAHFVVQFEGTAGVSNVYINGASTADTGSSTTWWGNEREGFTVGGRVLSARNFTSLDAKLDDFAIIPGVVTSADVIRARDSGVAGSGLTTSLHYALDEASGGTIGDSSGNGLDGTLLGYDNTQTRQARGIDTAMVPGVHGTAAEFYSGWLDHAKILAPTNMPTLGEAFTVAFWLKVGAWDFEPAEKGVLFAQNFGTLSLVIGCEQACDGLIIRTGTAGASPATIDTASINTAGLTPDEFAHFAITVDALGHVSAMYLNGDLATDTNYAGWVFGNSDTVTLGARLRGTAITTLDCEMDDFAIVKGELSKAQIERIMELGLSACIPEPSMTVLLLTGLVVLGFRRRAGRWQQPLPCESSP
ncbi:MAG TPA: hypothetical protein DD670_05735 [Planctomycetaceae bacterium]|nr:hypothetical protein [Planctomycetaceae bacterium]